MDLKRLRYFCAVIEHGTISQAARALNIAQPPLSKRLHELEEEIGAPLFLRGAKTIEATPAGRHLYHRACEILRSVDEAARETAEIATSQTRQLKIGLTHLYQNYFRDLILALSRANPDLQISVSVADSGYLELLLKNGLIDVALTQKPSHGEEYECRTFRPIKLVAVVSRTLLDGEAPREIGLADLGRLPLVLLRRADGLGTVELLMQRIQAAGAEPNILMFASQPGVILDWIGSGLEGATLLPETEVSSVPSDRFAVLDVTAGPELFHPSIVTLTTAPQIREIMALVADGYPFQP